MEPDELLPAFAARLGIEGLTVHDGACALEIDGMPVDIAPVPDGAALAVCAVIGKPPPEKEEIFLETLLETTIHFHSRDDMAFGLLSDTGSANRIGNRVQGQDGGNGTGSVLLVLLEAGGRFVTVLLPHGDV